MIENLKQDFPKSFFQIISEEGLFGEWNNNKTVFKFNLLPEIFEEYSEKKEHIYGYDYHPGFINKINFLIDLGVIIKYEKLSTNNFNKEEKQNYFDYFFNKGDSVSKNFFYYYEMEGGIYEFYYNLEKLKLFEAILYDTKNLKLNIKKQLFKTILYFIEKKNFDIPELGAIDIFDIEIITEELDIKEYIYIFYDIKLLLYSICSLQDRLYITRLLNYLVNNLKGGDKETLINSINGDNNFRYYSDEEIKSELVTSLDNINYSIRKSVGKVSKEDFFLYEGIKIGNIYYLENNVKENEENIIINEFLNKINKLKIFAKEGCLKIKLEQELIVELRGFNYKDIIFDEVILLKIEKLLSHPQTIWSSQSSRGFSSSVSPYILEWEDLYNKIINNNQNINIDSNESLKENNNQNNRIKDKQTNNKYSGLKIIGDKIKNGDGKVIYILKDLEKKIIRNIYDKTDDGGISISNIIEITKQTENAFKQYLKTFKKELKNNGLDNIEIKYNRSEKSYKCYIN